MYRIEQVRDRYVVVLRMQPFPVLRLLLPERSTAEPHLQQPLQVHGRNQEGHACEHKFFERVYGEGGPARLQSLQLDRCAAIRKPEYNRIRTIRTVINVIRESLLVCMSVCFPLLVSVYVFKYVRHLRWCKSSAMGVVQIEHEQICKIHDGTFVIGKFGEFTSNCLRMFAIVRVQ